MAASAGGGDAAGGKVHHRQAAFLAHGQADFQGSAVFLGEIGHFGLGQGAEHADLVHDLAAMAHGFHHVAGAGLALGADHGRAFGDAAQGLAQVAAAADEGHGEVALVDMIPVIGGGQHFAFVDVVHAQGLKDAGLHEMADAGLGHDGDAHHFHDALDDGGVGHAGDAAGGADVGRDAFKGHDGAGAGFFGDLRLFGGGHVHDDAALEHFCKTGLQANGALFHEKTPLSIQRDMQRKGKKALLSTAGNRRAACPWPFMDAYIEGGYAGHPQATTGCRLCGQAKFRQKALGFRLGCAPG